LQHPRDAANTAIHHAEEVLANNRRVGVKDGFQYDFTCPSPDSYPFQWAWDSCFHAIALANVDAPRAVREIESLLHGIDADGFLPHMLLWQEDLRAGAIRDFRIALWQGWKSVSLAPPVLARAVERVFETTGDESWLRRVVPELCRFYDWLDNVRGTDMDLLAIYHPDESGLDMSPKYDDALGLSTMSTLEVADGWHAKMYALLAAYEPDRCPDSALGTLGRFHWIDVLFNSIYADSAHRLAGLLRHVGRADLAERYDRRSLLVCEALIRECWDPHTGAFYDLDLIAGRQVPMLTVSSLFPLVLRQLPGPIAGRLVEHLTNADEFWLPFPVPSVAATEAAFDPVFESKGIFRGSSWVNLNWYLYWALRDRDLHTTAEELAMRTIAAVAASGMRECYGPLDADGHGATSFGWSSLVLDLAAAMRRADDMTGSAT
jgi:glycogen debranching enzyme